LLREEGLVTQSVSVLLLLSLILTIYYLFGQKVPAGQMGLRQIYYGPNKGFSETSLEPGFHWTVPFYSVIHLIPQTAQMLNIHREGTSEGEHQESMEVKTADGVVIDADVTVFYKIFKRKTAIGEVIPEGSLPHGGPRDLVENLSLSAKRWADQVRNVTTGELKRSLSKLLADNFYDPELRLKLVDEAKVNIQTDLARVGIDVEEVLLRRYTYRNQRIDDAIFLKNLQDQEVKLNEANGKLAEAKAKIELIVGEWEAKIQNLRVKAEGDAKVLRSEAELYEAEQRAKGDLEVDKSKAEVDKLKAGALANSVGADIFVARQIVPYLNSLKGGIVSGFDPYDIESLITKMGVKEIKLNNH
jgi:regulator of protease activity HflC (stomatin/prohibitin superfamily)